MLELQLIAAEVSLSWCKEEANNSLASWEASIRAEVDERLASSRQVLIEDHRMKLELQETRFHTRHRELKAEIGILKKKLAEANLQWKAALDA